MSQSEWKQTEILFWEIVKIKDLALILRLAFDTLEQRRRNRFTLAELSIGKTTGGICNWYESRAIRETNSRKLSRGKSQLR